MKKNWAYEFIEFAEDRKMFFIRDASNVRKIITGIIASKKSMNDNCVTMNECIENAKLIAAAPDLLDALIACDESMEYMSEYDIPITLPQQVKDAIAKATDAKPTKW